MPEVTIECKGLECAKCKHRWIPRGPVRQCPACKTTYWNEARPPKAGVREKSIEGDR